MAEPSPLRAGLVRLAVLFGGLLLLVGAGIAHAAEKLGTPWTLAAQYFGVMGIVWGLNGFFFRRLPLSRFTLPVFSAAAFGVLFLIGFFLKDVVGPFAIDSAGPFLRPVHPLRLIFFAFAVLAG